MRKARAVVAMRRRRARALVVVAGCVGSVASGGAPSPSGMHIHSIFDKGPCVGAGCGETLDLRFVAADGASLRSYAAALADARAEAAAAAEAEARAREAALVAARTVSALSEVADDVPERAAAAAANETSEGEAATEAAAGGRFLACQEACLGADGGAALAGLVAAAGDVTDVDVVDGGLGPGGFEKVFFAAVAGGSPVARLRVASDDVGDGGAVKVARRLARAAAKDADAAADANTTGTRADAPPRRGLERVALERLGFGSTGVEAVAKALALAGAGGLRSLSLRGNPACCDGGVHALSETGRDTGDSTSLQRGCSGRARSRATNPSFTERPGR